MATDSRAEVGLDNEPDSITQAELLEFAVGIHAAERRGLIGLTGPPGSGKSYLAARLTRSLCPSPPVVAMDGFHLVQAVIDAKGLRDRKGSPETFDSWGFVNLVTAASESGLTTAWCMRRGSTAASRNRSREPSRSDLRTGW